MKISSNLNDLKNLNPQALVKKGSINKIQFRQMEKQSKKFQQSDWGNWLIFDFFHDQIIYTANCEGTTIIRSFSNLNKNSPLELI